MTTSGNDQDARGPAVTGRTTRLWQRHAIGEDARWRVAPVLAAHDNAAELLVVDRLEAWRRNPPAETLWVDLPLGVDTEPPAEPVAPAELDAEILIFSTRRAAYEAHLEDRAGRIGGATRVRWSDAVSRAFDKALPQDAMVRTLGHRGSPPADAGLVWRPAGEAPPPVTVWLGLPTRARLSVMRVVLTPLITVSLTLLTERSRP